MLLKYLILLLNNRWSYGIWTFMGFFTIPWIDTSKWFTPQLFITIPLILDFTKCTSMWNNKIQYTFLWNHMNQVCNIQLMEYSSTVKERHLDRHQLQMFHFSQSYLNLSMPTCIHIHIKREKEGKLVCFSAVCCLYKLGKEKTTQDCYNKALVQYKWI